MIVNRLSGCFLCTNSLISMHIVLLIVVFIIGGLINQLRGQSLPGVKTTSMLQIDGQLDEEGWKQAAVVGGFRRNFPDDTAAAAYTTEVRVLYDDNNLYIAA